MLPSCPAHLGNPDFFISRSRKKGWAIGGEGEKVQRFAPAPLHGHFFDDFRHFFASRSPTRCLGLALRFFLVAVLIYGRQIVKIISSAKVFWRYVVNF
jgi:hypothetical protein